jgi:tetratricopeptide (TPR) repeat protein
VLRLADALSGIVASHAIGAYDLVAKLIQAWVRGRLSDAKARAAKVGAIQLAAQERGAHYYSGTAYLMLADLEAAAGDVDEALASVTRGLEIAAQQERGLLASPLHRLRGDILFTCDPAAAEEAYRESIRIASEQGGRTFVLLAALPLAKLLQTNNRPVEAHDILAPALNGFAPTPELPAVAETQALLAELAATHSAQI